MAGLTKEQRAQREAEKAQSQPAFICMVTEFPAFEGAPTKANVHPEEVEVWKAHGWKIEV
ncbi:MULTISPECIES: hypothetical protein [Tatumella]|uniref:Uncharacterized protein n=1 Tax=Tatumella punctata TaxID=399969 RepID=A0ABW1VSX5_9GAMM|nr:MULTISPECIES: hypothetical protein [unclassified Tatumella]MBS0878613.1 hypothetical protein [Tatumella sp. JGM82]MBS0892189.1 hypothetical protein [Tatumella sp. JGM94]MBS0895504.1 hypothetical protein [Tatumella sp. JGM130]MBS0903319.1 hypothetical protein [Tatumella sp. JGM100]